MGFLDFLTKPRLEATPQDPMSVTPYEQPQAQPSDGLLSAVPEQLGMGAPEQMQRMPQIEEKPSLLGGIGKQVFGTDEDGIGFWDRMYAAAGALGGENGGAYLNQKRQLARGEREKEQVKADLAKKNEAFKAAYQNGKFDPQAYLEAIGDSGDAGEAFSLAAKINPQPKYVEGPDGIYEIGEAGARRVADYPAEEPNAPSGFRWKEDGSGLELIPGYAEGVGQVTGQRRDAVVSRPMPRSSNGRGGGGGSSAKLPAGFILD